MSDKLSVGDTLTIEGVREMLPNTARKRWQLWRPRHIEGVNLARFILTDTSAPVNLRIWDGYAR